MVPGDTGDSISPTSLWAISLRDTTGQVPSSSSGDPTETCTAWVPGAQVVTGSVELGVRREAFIRSWGSDFHLAAPMGTPPSAVGPPPSQPSICSQETAWLPPPAVLRGYCWGESVPNAWASISQGGPAEGGGGWPSTPATWGAPYQHQAARGGHVIPPQFPASDSGRLCRSGAQARL